MGFAECPEPGAFMAKNEFQCEKFTNWCLWGLHVSESVIKRTATISWYENLWQLVKEREGGLSTGLTCTVLKIMLNISAYSIKKECQS